MKEFSNRYTLIYSAVLVLVAAALLTVVSVSLKPMQTENQEIETKQMLLSTIGVSCEKSQVNDLYAQKIQETESEDGKTYYTFEGGVIVPMHGKGLWGPIWGYLALNEDMEVVGAIFDHKGETPGLGGEISTDKFASRFIGKRMDVQPIRLNKHANQDSPYEVDAISGGTMTSNGVTEMLNTCFEEYKGVLR